MLDHAHLPPVRETMQTHPFDLSAYARTETGPESWSARADTNVLTASLLESPGDRACARVTDLLVSIAPSDVPRVAMSSDDLIAHVSLREAFVIASIDGESTLESLIHALDLPSGEVLTIVCELCASGILTLEQSRR